MRRVGILGGTFDPIHCGHLDAADAVQHALGLTAVEVLASHIPPHRTAPLASGYHRFAMVALAVANRAGWRASDLELQSAAPSYTAGTLALLHRSGFAPTELFFIVGADAFADIETWHDYPRVLDASHFAVVSRTGHPAGELRRRLPGLASRMVDGGSGVDARAATVIFLIDAPTADVSATAIRQRLSAGGSIAGLVPAGVQQHIEQHGLYTSHAPGDRATDAREIPAAGRLHGQN